MKYKIFILLFISTILVGCDWDRDDPISFNAIKTVMESCPKNDGMKSATRVVPFSTLRYEWIISCNDGATFILKTDINATIHGL